MVTMLVLTIRTDNPQAEIGLFDDGQKSAYETWYAHRQLAETIHTKINDLLQSQDRKLRDITGVICFKGPGSFTGLRIGLSVGNALAYGLGTPIISTMGKDWIAEGIRRLTAGEDERIALPEYGHDANITKPRK